MNELSFIYYDENGHVILDRKLYNFARRIRLYFGTTLLLEFYWDGGWEIVSSEYFDSDYFEAARKLWSQRRTNQFDPWTAMSVVLNLAF